MSTSNAKNFIKMENNVEQVFSRDLEGLKNIVRKNFKNFLKNKKHPRKNCEDVYEIIKLWIKIL